MKPLNYQLQERLIKEIREDERKKTLEDVREVINKFFERNQWHIESRADNEYLKLILQNQIKELGEK